MSAHVVLTNTTDVRALVDRADLTLLAQYSWHLKPNGYAARNTTVRGRSVTMLMHRFLLGLHGGDRRQGDHINGDRLDNRRANLRVVTQQENLCNRRSAGGSSQFRGVSWDRFRGAWVAQAKLAGRHIFLGRFGAELDAAKVIDAWRLENMPGATPDPALQDLLDQMAVRL